MGVITYLPCSELPLPLVHSAHPKPLANSVSIMMAQSFAIYLLFVLGSYHHSTHAFVSPNNYAAINQITNNNNNNLQILSQDDVSRSQQHTRGTRTSLNLAGGFEGAWSAYLDALEADPLLVKSITAGVILGAADLSGQAIQSAVAAKNGVDNVNSDTETGGVDFARFARFAFL